MTPFLRVATLNTWKGEGAYWRRLELMARGLSDLHLDAICLQECFAAQSEGADTAAYLCGQLGMRALVAPAREKLRRFGSADVLSTSGLAILVRGQARAIRICELPADPRDEDRIALRLDAEVGGRDIRILNVHLTHLQQPGAMELRRRQAAALAGFAVDGWSGRAVVAGDFNAALDSPDLECIEKVTTVDAGPDSPNTFAATMIRAGALPAAAAAKPPPEPARAIDHVLLLGGPGRIVSRSLALTQPTGQERLFASDHAAVVAEIDLPGLPASEAIRG